MPRKYPMIVLLIWSIWAAVMVCFDLWHLLEKHWPAGLTMGLGSFIAGSTSEGGGAIAFPVFTLGFGLAPHVARDFSLLIQSVGMGMAAFFIYKSKTPFFQEALLPVSLGGFVGILMGLFWIAPLVPPKTVKIFFVSIWIAFAGVMIVATRLDRSQHLRKLKLHITKRRFLILSFTGIIGGCVSGLTGSGIDMVTFAVLILLFRADLNVAVPTSVVLMFINSFIGSAAMFGFRSPSALSLELWAACIPIVIVGAPLGAAFIRGKSQAFITRLVVTLCVVQYLTALFVIRPDSLLLSISVTTMALAIIAFFVLYYCGLDGAKPNKEGHINDQILARSEEISHSKK